jgi:hypothetical protein
MYDITRDPEFRIADAAEILEAHDIELFIIDGRKNAQDEWCELTAEHGERIAVAQPSGDELIVSWPVSIKPVAWRIRQAFRTVGMRATWDGEVWNAVHVNLAIPAKDRSRRGVAAIYTVQLVAFVRSDP